jgi:hypothetical protein
LVTASERLEPIGNEIISNFDRVVPLYYHTADQARGYIETEDRFGEMRRFGIMTISLAAVHVKPGQFRSHAEIAEKAAELKKKAKTIDKSVLVHSSADTTPSSNP